MKKPDSEYIDGYLQIGPGADFRLPSFIPQNINLIDLNSIAIKESGFTKHFSLQLPFPIDSLRAGLIPFVNGYCFRLSWGWGYTFNFNERSLLSLTGGLGFWHGMSYDFSSYENLKQDIEFGFSPIIVDLRYAIFFGSKKQHGIALGLTGSFGISSSSSEGFNKIKNLSPSIGYSYRFKKV